MRYGRLASPVGELVLAADGASLRGVWFDPHRGSPSVSPEWERDDDALAGVAAQLDAWFRGAMTAFDVEVDIEGTPFQRRVWAALGEIPYGSTATYRDLVDVCGGSPRAVGAANAANPLSIVVPCHRLVGTGGGLTGYAGGVDAKRWLLDHESRVVAGNVGPSSLQP